jgi:hypothetical protein
MPVHGELLIRHAQVQFSEQVKICSKSFLQKRADNLGKENNQPKKITGS